MNDRNRSAPRAHPDLDRALRAFPEPEADRLREVWDLAALAVTEDALDTEAAARTERVLGELTRAQTNGTGDVHLGEGPRVEHSADRPPVRRPRPRRRFVVWTPIALAAVLALVWLGLPVTHEAAPGERLDVQLPDRSVVTLNSGSTLRHARLFGALPTARIVRLDGEAFFDVESSETPFVVHTFDAHVTVLGTTFGVRAWADEPATTVAVVSGRVRLAPEGRPEAGVVLTPDQVKTLAEGGVADVGAGSTSDALAWRQGDLVYKDRPLGVVLRDVERRFGVGVTPQSAALGDRRVSVALRAPASAEEIVRDLATAFGLRYRARAGGFEVYQPPPSSLSTP